VIKNYAYHAENKILIAILGAKMFTTRTVSMFLLNVDMFKYIYIKNYNIE